MRHTRAWTGSGPESETEQSRMRTIRATRKVWELLVSTANKRDRAMLVKDTRTQARLDAEPVTLDHQLASLEVQLATLDAALDQEASL